jgi:hypothetical protein
MRLRWLLIALALSLVLLGIHLYALDNHLYWYYRWLDTPVHIIAGAMMGAAVVGVLLKFRPYSYMIAIAFGSIGWEAFEYIIARYTIWRSR